VRLRLLLLLVAGLLVGCGGDDGDGDGGNGTSAGASVYADAGCGSCHTFTPAGSNGTIGPNLDETEVTFERAVEQIRNGGSGMPAFKDQLSEQEIEDVSRFVAGEEGSATGKDGGSVVGPFALTARG
jgi:mono/diheme cytochrome c family protein